MSVIVIDRRLNPGNKNAENKYRMMRRATEDLLRAMDKTKHDGSVASKSAREVILKTEMLDEYYFIEEIRHLGVEVVLPGNFHELVVGDYLNKERTGRGGSGDSDDDRDEFVFLLGMEEYLDIVFDGLELPRLVKKTEHDEVYDRCGLSRNGPMPAIDMQRSACNAIGRRIGLRRPKRKEIEDETDEEKKRILIKKRRSVPWLDPVDLRFRHYDLVPSMQPRAVIFFIMDISGSMTEKIKTLAKRFFLLMYHFVRRNYAHTEIVFINHTNEAMEVDEHEFFYGQRSGGTVLSPAIILADKIWTERFDADWNGYVVQVSDGENSESDDMVAMNALESLADRMQGYIYLEIDDTNAIRYQGSQTFYRVILPLNDKNPYIVPVSINDDADVVVTFRKIFGTD